MKDMSTSPTMSELFNLKSKLMTIPVPITVSNHMYNVAANACATKCQVASWAISHGLNFLEECLEDKPVYFTDQVLNIEVEVYEHIEDRIVIFCKENDIQDINVVYALVISKGMIELFR